MRHSLKPQAGIGNRLQYDTDVRLGNMEFKTMIRALVENRDNIQQHIDNTNREMEMSKGNAGKPKNCNRNEEFH